MMITKVSFTLVRANFMVQLVQFVTSPKDNELGDPLGLISTANLRPVVLVIDVIC